LIEYIKGNQTKLLDAILESVFIPQINHIVYSEFMFHFLSVMSGKSPLTLKKASQISELLQEHEPLEFIKNFQILDMNEDILLNSYDFMNNYHLLPTDALIFSSCKYYDQDLRKTSPLPLSEGEGIFHPSPFRGGAGGGVCESA